MHTGTLLPARSRPPAVDYAATDDRRLLRVGLAIVLVVFGGFGAWAAIAPLSSAAHAPGVISVESYRKTIQHLEGGIVRTIEVRDGQSVEKDQVLLTMDDTQSRAQMEVLRGHYLVTLAREARLIAQRDGLAAIEFPAELQRNARDPRAEEAMRVQSQTFRARKAAYDGEIGLYTQQVGQLEARARGLRSQMGSREQLARSFKGELEDFEALVKEGYSEKQKVRELERNVANTEGQLGELTSNLAATALQISETKLKILQLQKELQREVAKELAEVQGLLYEVREKLQSIEDTVVRTVIRAPQPGTVLGLAVHTLGAVVKPGEKVMDIVPKDERLVVEAKVSPIDIDRVQTGQSAEIRFSAFKMRDTPKVDGTVVFLSADRLVDETDQGRMPYYLARVEITPSGLADLSRQKLALMAGMPAEVLINTGERTFLEYMVDPIRNTVARSFIED